MTQNMDIYILNVMRNSYFILLEAVVIHLIFNLTVMVVE
jgi:hypothetical protein